MLIVTKQIKLALLTFLHCKHFTLSKCRATEFSSLLSISVITEFFFPDGRRHWLLLIRLLLLLPSSDKQDPEGTDPDKTSGPPPSGCGGIRTSSTPTISSSSWKHRNKIHERSWILRLYTHRLIIHHKSYKDCGDNPTRLHRIFF